MFDATLPMLTPEMFSNISAMGVFDDEQSLGLDDMDEEKDVIGDLPSSAKKGKLGSSTAEKKATHNAVERARRESLNGRFLVLADMLPGMNHVKRASKSAIVNKSIEYIRELQAVETKMAKDNNKLKTEIAALKAAAKNGAASQDAAVAAAVSAPLASPFAGTMPALASPIVATFAAAQQSQSPHVRHPSFSAGSGGNVPISLPSMEFSSISPPQPSPTSNLFHASQMLDLSGSHMFSQVIPVMPQQHQQVVHKRSDTASPASQVSSLSAPPKTADSAVTGLQQQQQVQAQLQAQAQALASDLSFPSGNYFELAGLGAGPLGAVASPTSYNTSLLFQTAASDNSASSSGGLAASTTTAPSPASSYSVQTPGNNAYSPVSIPTLGGEVSSSNASNAAGSPRTNTATATATVVTESPSAAVINEANAIAKAQADLQTFMAYQQRMATAAAMNMNIAATTHGNNGMNPFAAAAAAAAAGMLSFSPHHHHAQAPIMSSGPPPNNPFVNVPAWQMMMAQQAALSAYGGGANGPF